MASPEKVLEVVTNKLMALTDFINSVVGENGNTIGLARSTSIPSPNPIGGRLSFISGSPSMGNTAVVSGAAHYWVPYDGQYIPLWNGTNFIITNMGGELSQLATDTTKSPAAVAASSIYDIFGWVDGTTPRATRGPVWSNSGGGTSARGAGAGTTELELVQGYYVNKYDIINGPAARYGLYLGSIISDSSGTYTYTPSSDINAAGVGSNIPIWNKYNKLDTSVYVTDTGAAFTYSTATIRALRANSGFAIDVLCGLPEDCLSINYIVYILTTAVATSNHRIAIGTNSTTALDVNFGVGMATGLSCRFSLVSDGSTDAALGYNRYTGLQCGDAATAVSCNNTPATTATKNIMSLEFLA